MDVSEIAISCSSLTCRNSLTSIFRGSRTDGAALPQVNLEGICEHPEPVFGLTVPREGLSYWDTVEEPFSGVCCSWVPLKER